jgi:hypothetical protein
LKTLAALAALLPAFAHAEVCRFSGTTSHDGRVGVRTETMQAGGLTTVDVTVAFDISAWLSDVRYLGEEISAWRGGELESLAVNQRTIVGGSIKRQQWDVFTRNGARLEAYRVQAKRLADFRARHPGFVQHWAPASFGQPWLQDYRAAKPERRPDLDLPASDAQTRSPLALAFYWSRFLPPGGGVAPVILPGFKRDKESDIRFGPAVAGQGWLRWSAPMRHPGLESSPVSLAAAWISPQDYLLQLGFEVHAPLASGQALIRTEGCQGVQIRPE